VRAVPDEGGVMIDSLDQDALAQRLNVNQKTVRILVDKGDIPTVRIGVGRRMIEQAALDAYIVHRRENPPLRGMRR
jgi:excisionase family DNA binding protein